MKLASGKEDAGATRDGRGRCSGPHPAAPLEDAEHLLVLVIVVGRAAWRNRADELRDLRAAGPSVDEHAIPAVAGGLRGALGEANDGRRVRRFLERRRDWWTPVGIGTTRADQGHQQP